MHYEAAKWRRILAHGGMFIPRDKGGLVFYVITPCTCRRGFFWRDTDITDLVVIQEGTIAFKDGKPFYFDNPKKTMMLGCTRFGCVGRVRSNYKAFHDHPRMNIDAWKKSKEPWLKEGPIDHMALLGMPKVPGDGWGRGGFFRRLMGLPPMEPSKKTRARYSNGI